MIRRSTALLLAILLPLTLAACGDGADSGGPGGGGPDGSGAAAATVPLDQDTIDRYVATAKDLKALGAEVDAEMDESSTDLGRAATALTYNRAWEGKLADHGFTWERFMKVHTTVIGALMASEMESKRAEMEKSLAEAKANLPPEQYEMMKKSMESSFGMFGNATPENRALVEKNAGKIKAAWE